MTSITSFQPNAEHSSNVIKQENEIKDSLFAKREIKNFIHRKCDFVYKKFYRINKAMSQNIITLFKNISIY